MIFFLLSPFMSQLVENRSIKAEHPIKWDCYWGILYSWYNKKIKKYYQWSEVNTKGKGGRTSYIENRNCSKCSFWFVRHTYLECLYFLLMEELDISSVLNFIFLLMLRFEKTLQFEKSPYFAPADSITYILYQLISALIEAMFTLSVHSQESYVFQDVSSIKWTYQRYTVHQLLQIFPTFH